MLGFRVFWKSHNTLAAKCLLGDKFRSFRLSKNTPDLMINKQFINPSNKDTCIWGIDMSHCCIDKHICDKNNKTESGNALCTTNRKMGSYISGRSKVWTQAAYSSSSSLEMRIFSPSTNISLLNTQFGRAMEGVERWIEEEKSWNIQNLSMHWVSSSVSV